MVTTPCSDWTYLCITLVCIRMSCGNLLNASARSNFQPYGTQGINRDGEHTPRTGFLSPEPQRVARTRASSLARVAKTWHLEANEWTSLLPSKSTPLPSPVPSCTNSPDSRSDPHTVASDRDDSVGWGRDCDKFHPTGDHKKTSPPSLRHL